MKDPTLILAGLALVVVLMIVGEGIIANLDRRANPDREARRPRYKPLWQGVGLIAWNGPIIAALFLFGEWPALGVGAISLGAYAVFRYRLQRSPSMQRRFLSAPLPREDASANNRNP